MGYKLRLTLLIGLIVGPAGILTFLSLRTVLDEQRSALSDLRLRLPAVQSAFQTHLQSTLDRVQASGTGTELPEVEFVFVLGEAGEFTEPLVLPPVLFDRSPAFSATLRRGEEQEFSVGNLPSAQSAYQQALELSVNDGERAEALQALQRCSCALGDTATTETIHLRLRQQFSRTLDADGSHPLTHSYLRRARGGLPGVGSGADPDSILQVRGLQAITRWSADVLAGDLPLHPGTALAVRDMGTMLQRYNWTHDVGDGQADLDAIGHRADLVATYDRLLETAVVRQEATYPVRSGSRWPILVCRPSTAGPGQYCRWHSGRFARSGCAGQGDSRLSCWRTGPRRRL